MSHPNHLQAVMQKLLADHGEYYPQLLEQRFPHILKRIIAYWGKPEMDDYLDSLMAPPQAGAKGFPQEAIFEIVEIQAVHRAMFRCESPVASPQVDKAPVADSPAPLTDTDHEDAMVFDRHHRR